MSAQFLVAPIDISENEGFDEHDLFGHQQFGDELTNLLEWAHQSPLVVALDGPWGCGKTTFTKMWCGHLRQRRIPVIYFDAFANDYQEDAFIALASEVLALAEEETVDGLDEMKMQARNAAKVLLRHVPKIAVKAITFGAIDTDGIASDLEKDVAKAASDITDQYVADRLEKHAEERSIFETFRQSLTELSKKLSVDKPLVVVVNELDRCRPSFALDMLEKIKHFFSVPSVHFVFVTNLNQLCGSVRAQYGTDEARTYLEKFFDLHLKLPLITERRVPVVERYIDHVFAPHNNRFQQNSMIADVRRELRRLSIHLQLSLRSIDKIFSMLAFYFSNLNDFETKFSSIIPGLAIMRLKNNELYERARSGRIQLKEVLSFLDIPVDENFDDKHDPRWRPFYDWHHTLADPIPDRFGKENRMTAEVRSAFIPNVCRAFDRVRLT